VNLTAQELWIENVVRQLAGLMILTLLLGSAGVWWRVLRAGSEAGGLAWNPAPRADWSSLSERTVLGLMFLMLVLFFRLLPVEPSSRPVQDVTAGDLARLAIVNFGLALVLPGILVSGPRPLRAFGIRADGLMEQIRDGVWGFLLSLLPMIPFLIATAPFRTRETQNSLLRLLADDPTPGTIALIALLAVVIAPLFEEMVFRVVLQGWLSTVVSPAVSIPVTALIFAGIHGTIDGIALIPLALVLGWVFHRRHSYVSVLVIHGLFNATMLALTPLNSLKPAP